MGLICVYQQQGKLKMPSEFTHLITPTTITNDWRNVVADLVTIRNSKKISQEKLAHTIGCTASLVHKWEQFKRIPSGFMFVCWADALDAKIQIEIRQNR